MPPVPFEENRGQADPRAAYLARAGGMTAYYGAGTVRYGLVGHDPAEVERFIVMLKKKYPEYMAMPAPDMRQIRIFRLTPKVISVLDYTKGFAHTDLVTL